VLTGSAAAAGVVAIEKAEIAIVSASFAAALAHPAFEVTIVIPPIRSDCPGTMTSLSCAERLFESCECCRAVAVSADVAASAIYARGPVTNDFAAVRLPDDQLDVTPAINSR